MRRALTASIWIGLLTSLSVGCAAAVDQGDDPGGATGEARASADDVAAEGDFCLSLARAAAAIESGSPATAEDATEEALAQAPDEVVDETRLVADAVREARDDDAWDPEDPELTAAVEQLAATASRTCAPE